MLNLKSEDKVNFEYKGVSLIKSFQKKILRDIHSVLT